MSGEVEKSLRFSDLSARHLGVSDGISNNYSEAARVCLDRHHKSPMEFRLRDNGKDKVASARWVMADDRTRNAWANKDDATEAGAYALALAAIEVLRGLVAVGRAETRTGADYYLCEPNSTLEDLEASFRLEVSGTDEGSDSIIRSRLREKLDQAKRGNSNLPAIASVVGFAALQIVSADLSES
jgi:hypothetical protein